jgi:hypothetical protein
MFNPTSIDEFYVQATHIDSRGNNVKDNFSNKSFQPIEGKNKVKGKLK